jgi:hypothetical protein
MSQEIVRPALLTRTEFEYLLGKKEVSEGCARKIRHDINQKLQILTSTEIPLLQSNGFNITAGTR